MRIREQGERHDERSSSSWSSERASAEALRTSCRLRVPSPEVVRKWAGSKLCRGRKEVMWSECVSANTWVVFMVLESHSLIIPASSPVTKTFSVRYFTRSIGSLC